jgi:hypothetical protein
MGEKIQLDQENKAILIFDKKRNTWENRSMSISAMFTVYKHGRFTGYHIYFKYAGKKNFFKEEKVQILNKIKNINIKKLDIYVAGKIIRTALGLDEFEKGYYRLYIKDGTIFTQNIELKSRQYKDIFAYYYKLAEYAGTIAEEKSPLYFLAKNYERIAPLSDDSNSVLIDYLQGVCKPITDEELLLLPFDFNQSQIRAIDTALKNKISIIEGPPGTGKTQTILNMIANIIYHGKNCAVVSNNNTAIDNVYEKLSEEKLSFIAATLGRQANVRQFFESDQNGELSSFLEQNEEPITPKSLSKITKLSGQMKKIQDTEVETSILESQLTDIQNEKRHYDNISDDTLIINQRLSSKDYMSFITHLEKQKKLWFYERWILGIKFKIKIELLDVNILLSNAEKLYYQSRINEISSKIELNKEFLEKHNKEQVGKELKSLYRLLLNNFLRMH